MHTIVISFSSITPWQQRRIFSACDAFLAVLDPKHHAKNDLRIGWTYVLSTGEACRHFATFFAALTGRTVEEQANCMFQDHVEGRIGSAPRDAEGVTR